MRASVPGQVRSEEDGKVELSDGAQSVAMFRPGGTAWYWEAAAGGGYGPRVEATHTRY